MLPIHEFQVDVAIVVVHVVGRNHQTPLQIESTAWQSSMNEYCRSNSMLADTCVCMQVLAAQGVNDWICSDTQKSATTANGQSVLAKS